MVSISTCIELGASLLVCVKSDVTINLCPVYHASDFQWIVSTDKMSRRLRSSTGTSGSLEQMRTSCKSSYHLTHLTVSHAFLLEIIFQSNIIIRVPTVMERHGKAWGKILSLKAMEMSWNVG